MDRSDAEIDPPSQESPAAESAQREEGRADHLRLEAAWLPVIADLRYLLVAA